MISVSNKSILKQVVIISIKEHKEIWK